MFFSRALQEATEGLSHLSTSELERLHRQPDQLEQFIQRLPTIKSISSMKNRLIEQKKEFATKNLRLEKIFLRERDQLIRLHQLLKTHREEYLKLKQNDLPSAELVLVQLQSLLEHHEHLDEELIEHFFRTSNLSDEQVEEFLFAFLPQRTETVRLRVFAEKFLELYRKG